MVLACLLFIKRMSEETRADSWTYIDDEDDTQESDREMKKLPREIRVYNISGPLFFGAADIIEKIIVKEFTTCLVLRMTGVPALDSTALNALQDLVAFCKSKNITVVFSHVNEQPMSVMARSGFDREIGHDNICPSIDAALERASAIDRRSGSV